MTDQPNQNPPPDPSGQALARPSGSVAWAKAFGTAAVWAAAAHMTPQLSFLPLVIAGAVMWPIWVSEAE
jgi:hypothetical protein